MTVNFRDFAAEINLRHDAMDVEREAVAEIFDRLRTGLRENGFKKLEVQQKVADFKLYIQARRKFGEGLNGYEERNDRVLEMAALIESAASNKRTSAAPKPIVTASARPLRAGASETVQTNSTDNQTASTNSPVNTPTPSPIPEQTEPVADDASSPIPDDEFNRIPNFLNRAPVDLVSV